MIGNRSSSLWAPFRFAPFRWLWLGALLMNLAIWMQNVGAAWLMVSLTSSPLMIALVQTAISLPSFFFGLPGGVFADIFNRRRYLLLTQTGTLLVALLLVLFCALDLVGSLMLLSLTFAFGIGYALQGPAWYTAQSEAVPPFFTASAMALSSVSYSSARAVGPALAGGIVATSGVFGVFVVCSVLLLGSVLVVFCMKSTGKDNSLPAESLWAGLRGALRYVRHSDIMRAQCLRTCAFVAAGSGLWALLPVVAGVSGDASNYGLLLGSIGTGTMVGALILPKMRARLEINALITVACALYALSGLVVALVPSTPIQCFALFLAGIGWLCVGTTNLVVIQSAVPPWIRARTVAIYMLMFQGGLAIGGALWGGVASYSNTSNALVAASIAVALSILVMCLLPAREGTEAAVTPANSDAPTLPVINLGSDDGPIAVQVGYCIRSENRVDFLREVHVLGKIRRRDGASFWCIYRDLERPSLYVERFLVDSWAGYLRQQARTTLADRKVEERVKALHSGAEPPKISHFIGEASP